MFCRRVLAADQFELSDWQAIPVTEQLGNADPAMPQAVTRVEFDRGLIRPFNISESFRELIA